ncbi:MAG: hypothetical protein RXP92_00095 [Candidatus Micrarchaeota archaeon]
MRNGRYVVGIDFDGTLTNLDSVFKKHFPIGGPIAEIIENIVFFVADVLGVGQHFSKKILDDGVQLNEGLKELIKELQENDVDVVVVTANKNIKEIKEILAKNGLELEVLYSKRGGKNGFKFIDILLDDSYSEINKKVLWEGRHNSILAHLLKLAGRDVAASPEEFKEILRKDMEKKAVNVKINTYPQKQTI